MIVTAASEHLDGIRALWQQAFGDDNEYIDLFLGKRARLSDTLVYLCGGDVCGMLFLLPCRLVFGQQTFSCAYLYGVATASEHRGQGISSRLLGQAHDLCAARGYDVCALVPADKPLFDFYAKRGYSTQGYVKTLSISAGQPEQVAATPVLSLASAAEVVRLRGEWFGGGYLEWDEAAIDYAIEENRQMGGQFYSYSIDGEAGSLCCLPRGDSLVIKEWAGNISRIYDVTAALHRIYHKQSYLFRLSNSADMGENTPFAMTHWITGGTDKPFYLSLVLD